MPTSIRTDFFPSPATPRRAARRRAESGMAFALTMLVLFIILCAALAGTMSTGPNATGSSGRGNGLLKNVDDSVTSAGATVNYTTAFDAAESGVEYTLEWLHSLSAPPANTAAWAPALWNANTSSGRAVYVMNLDGTLPPGNQSQPPTFSVEIYPDTSNPNQINKRYLIESVGTYAGVTQIVTAYIQEASFGKYAYFTNTDFAGGYWVVGVNSFDGPMHSNDAGGTTPNILWYTADTTAPLLTYTGTDAFTCSSSTINWNANTVGNQQAPSSMTDWAHVAAGGQTTVHTGVATIPMPTSSTQQLNAAWPNGSPPTSQVGVSVSNQSGGTNGGIYIHGNVSQMTLTASGANNVVQQIAVSQTDTSTSPSTAVATNITIDPTVGASGTTTVTTTRTNGGSTTTTTSSYTGTTNGVVYDDSSIGHQETPGDPNYDGYSDTGTAYNAGYDHGRDMTGGVSGTIADNMIGSGGNVVHQSQLTIATPDTNSLGKAVDMNIDGSLTTSTQRQLGANGAYLPESQDANFVAKAGTLGLVSNTLEIVDKDKNGNPLTAPTIDASIYAYNTFDAADLLYHQGSNSGTMQLMGGYIGNISGVFGLMTQSGQIVAGLAESYHYDNRLANTPPPFFPTTGMEYDVLSWRRVGSTLQ